MGFLWEVKAAKILQRRSSLVFGGVSPVNREHIVDDDFLVDGTQGRTRSSSASFTEEDRGSRSYRMTIVGTGEARCRIINARVSLIWEKTVVDSAV